jgi:DNA repair exonuclease SbcCD ATPase subunit
MFLLYGATAFCSLFFSWISYKQHTMSADQIIQNASRRLQYKDKLMGQMSNVDRCDTSATMNQQNFLRIQQQIRLQRQIIDQKTDALDEAERRIKETARNKQVFLEKWDYNLKKWEKKCSRMRADYLNAKEASIVAVDQGPMRDLANIRDEKSTSWTRSWPVPS